MVSALFDTNILIDFLRAAEPARAEIDRYTDRAISIVTWMEVMAGADPEMAAATRLFLETFQRVPLDEPVAQEAVALRRAYRIKLPDAIIWASARRRGMLLVTRNSKDFPASEPGVRIPYQL